MHDDAPSDDGTYDLVVIGAGAAGMTAALTAALHGLRVVLCEASDQLGGTTATSAGTLWVPGNRHGIEAGHDDTREAAARYLEALQGPDDAHGLRRAFLDTAAEAIDFLERHSSVHFQSAGRHPDYMPLPGAAENGRALSPVEFDGRLLGSHFDRVRPPMSDFMVLGGMMLGKADVQALIRRYRSPRAFVRSARLLARHAVDRLRYPRGTRLVLGNALVARLYDSLLRTGVPVRFGCALASLVRQEGRVVGATVASGGRIDRLQARRGVVLATGGIGHGSALRRRLGIDPRIESLAFAGVRGDGIDAALAGGAALTCHLPALFWQPVSRVPDGAGGYRLFPHLYLDRPKPGLIAVDAHGRRFVNEASSYHHFSEAMLAHPDTAMPCYLICDADFVRRYGLGVIPPGTRRTGPWERRGYGLRAATLTELAGRLGIEAEALSETVAANNRHAREGVDPDFGKGSTILNRFNGDPSHQPNPCLGIIARPPFHALPVWPADAASSAGLATDADGVVLDEAGRGIAGLYACGNDMASVMRGAYPGPGTTLGPAIVFAYRVGRHAARTVSPAHEERHAPA